MESWANHKTKLKKYWEDERLLLLVFIFISDTEPLNVRRRYNGAVDTISIVMNSTQWNEHAR